MSRRAVRVRRAQGVPFRVIGDEVIVAPPGDGFDMLSGAAVAVWSVLEIPRTVSEIVRVLAKRFTAAPTTIERDVRAVIERLRSIGAVEVVDRHG